MYKQAEGIKGMLSLDDEVLGKVTINPTPLSSKVKGILSRGESFYNINYGSSIIASKVSQIISVIVNINTDVYVFFKKKCE